jgi:DNA primase
MDVVSLARHGVRDAVATLGTSTTGEHVKRVFRVVPEVVFCFDGDKAGRGAAWRALQATLPELRDGRQARFLFLPEGEDPDSLVRKEGHEAFAARIADSLPLSDYLLDELHRQVGSDSLDARARLAELARPLLKLLPAGVYRELLGDRLANEVGLRPERLAKALGDPPPAPAKPAPSRQQRKPLPASARPSLVRQAISIVLNLPGVAAGTDVPPELRRVQIKGAPLLVELLDLARNNPGLTPGALVERFRDRPEGPHLLELLAAPMLVREDAAPRELSDSLARILTISRDERMAELVSKAGKAGLSPDEKEEFRQLQRETTGIR